MLSPQKQIEFAQWSLSCKNEFWCTDFQGNQVLNSTDYRGRIYKPVASIPHVMQNASEQTLHLAAGIDKTLQVVNMTHLINLFYKPEIPAPTKGYIPWHQDNGENDGEKDHPVLSFSIGDACDFLVTHSRPKISHHHPLTNPLNLAHRITLESGDALIFSGQSRMIWHAIYHISPNTTPPYLPFQTGRMNYTFRHTPLLINEEARFATVRADALPKDNQFFNLSKMK